MGSLFIQFNSRYLGPNSKCLGPINEVLVYCDHDYMFPVIGGLLDFIQAALAMAHVSIWPALATFNCGFLQQQATYAGDPNSPK